ncbi:MAG: hypothetical protein AAF664_13500 [Planctomycetota bacterium]
MKKPLALLLGSTIISAAGCSTLSSVSNSDTLTGSSRLPTTASLTDQNDGASKPRISNPKAREVRFDGQELVLGAGDCQSISVGTLKEITQDLRSKERYRSASETVRLHRRSSSRFVVESIANANDATLRWVAETLDRDAGNTLHKDLCDAASKNADAAKAFDAARRQCLTSIAGGTSDSSLQQRLTASAAELGSPLATLEAERLAAMGEVVSGEPAIAGQRLSAAAQIAATASSAHQCAQLWLLASEAFLRAEMIDASAQAWRNAIKAQVTAMTARTHDGTDLPALDTVFWEQADRLRPAAVEFPPEVSLAMNAWKLRIGIGEDKAVKPAAALWSAVAAFQLTMSQPHLATLSIKRAEVEASDAAKPWLKISLARSIAAQGQTPVATTILGSLTSHKDTNVRAASLATLGSIKVQAGAYEQGSRFLMQSLTVADAEVGRNLNDVNGGGVASNAIAQWPGRLSAEADLANVRLIIGDLEEARDALHAVQQKLALRGRWQSLVQSLENEAAILELDGDTRAAKEIRRRILEVERQSV